MPELPEVETVVRHLRPDLTRQTITSFKSIWPNVLGNISEKRFNTKISGKLIINVIRRAKFVVLKLENGFIPIHLRMTGKLYPNEEITDDRHISAIFELDRKYLIFHDTRKFGRIYWYNDWLEFDKKLGIEPLSELFTKEWLTSFLQSHKRQMKTLLLNQRFIVGLGNIYVDEVLWSARVHPLTLSNSVSVTKSNRLHTSIKTILEEAISCNGTTFINFAFQNGVPGSYRNKLRVFDRKNEPCLRCGKRINKIRVAGRGTYFCSSCQKR